MARLARIQLREEEENEPEEVDLEVEDELELPTRSNKHDNSTSTPEPKPFTMEISSPEYDIPAPCIRSPSSPPVHTPAFKSSRTTGRSRYSPIFSSPSDDDSPARSEDGSPLQQRVFKPMNDGRFIDGSPSKASRLPAYVARAPASKLRISPSPKESPESLAGLEDFIVPDDFVEVEDEDDDDSDEGGDEVDSEAGDLSDLEANISEVSLESDVSSEEEEEEDEGEVDSENDSNEDQPVDRQVVVLEDSDEDAKSDTEDSNGEDVRSDAEDSNSDDDGDDDRRLLVYHPPNSIKPRKLMIDLENLELTRPATPPTTTQPRPITPITPPDDTVWDLENHQFPVAQKPWMSPTKKKQTSIVPPTPNRRQLAQQKREWEASRQSLAENYIALLDSKITSSKISRLTKATGGIHMIWCPKLQTTAGTACGYRRGPNDDAVPQVLSEPDFIPNSSNTTYHARIKLSTGVCTNKQRVIDTLAHEFCHILVALLDDKGNAKGGDFHHHGPNFKHWALKVSKIMNLEPITRCHDYAIDYKYEWACTNAECTFKVGRKSKSLDVTKKCCGLCRGRLVQTKPKPMNTPAKPVAANGYLQFRSKNYKRAKNMLPPRSPVKDINAKISEMWKSRKEKEETIDGVDELVDQMSRRFNFGAEVGGEWNTGFK